MLANHSHPLVKTWHTSSYAPKLINRNSCRHLLTREAQILIQLNLRFHARAAIWSASTYLIPLTLGFNCLFIASFNDLNLVLLLWNGDFGDVLFTFFIDTLHTEERRRHISLKQSVYLGVDGLNLLYFETKNVITAEFTGLQHKCCAVFRLTDTDAFDLDPRQRNIEVFAKLGEPDNSNICDDEGSQIALLSREVPYTIVFREDLLVREHY